MLSVLCSSGPLSPVKTNQLSPVVLGNHHCYRSGSIKDMTTKMTIENLLALSFSVNE